MPDSAAPKYRLAVYAPFGPRLGVLPSWMSYDYVDTLADDPTLNHQYPTRVPIPTVGDGPQWEPAPGFEYLAGEHELAYETYDPQADEFEEHQNGRLRIVKEHRDTSDGAQLRTYTYDGIGSLLHMVPIRHPEVHQPAEGDQRPVRIFRDKTVGFIWRTLLDEAHADGYILGIGATFNNLNDSDNQPWPTIGVVRLPVEMTLHGVLEMFRDRGHWETSWLERDLRAYIPRTFLQRDLTELDEPPVIRYGQGVTSSPTDIEYGKIHSRALLLLDEGRLLEVGNPADDGPWGPLMSVVSVSGTSDSDIAQAAATEDLRTGKARLEQVVREIAATGAAFWPYIDYRNGDLLPVQRGTDDDGEYQTPTLRLLQIGISDSASGPHWALTLGDRRSQLIARAVQRVARITGGTSGGHAGQITNPVKDARQPDPETDGLLLDADAGPYTLSTYADATNQLRGQVDATMLWATIVAAVEPAYPEGPLELAVDSYEFQIKRPGRKWVTAAPVDADDTSDVATIGKGYDPAEALRIRWRMVSHEAVPGPWAEPVDVTFPADQSPTDGADLIVDAGFATSDICTKRAAATSGLAFEVVSGDIRAAFTSTSAVLDLGIGGTPTSGRKGCRPNDTVVLDFEAAYVTGASGSVKGEIRVWNAAGTVVGTYTVVATVTVTGSMAFYRGTFGPLPAGSKKMAARITTPALGAGAKVHVRNPNLDRITVRTRIGDGEVVTEKVAVAAIITDRIAAGNVTEDRQATGSTSTRVLADLAATTGKLGDQAATGAKIHHTDNLGPDHTSTGALLRAAAGGSGWKGSTSGLYFYDSAGLAFEATSAGVSIRGELEAGSVLISDDTIAVGDTTLTFDSGSLQMSTPLVVDGAVNCVGLSSSAGVSIGGALAQSGGSTGFHGATPSAAITVGGPATDPASTMALANAIRAGLITKGLFTTL